MYSGMYISFDLFDTVSSCLLLAVAFDFCLIVSWAFPGPTLPTLPACQRSRRYFCSWHCCCFWCFPKVQPLWWLSPKHFSSIFRAIPRHSEHSQSFRWCASVVLHKARNLPNKYNQQMLIDELNSAGPCTRYMVTWFILHWFTVWHRTLWEDGEEATETKKEAQKLTPCKL